jgi:hypothetical protein
LLPSGCAQDVLEKLLAHPLVAAAAGGAVGGSALMCQIRFLVLRNLAELLAVDDASALRALHLFGSAGQLDGDDIVLWDRMGTLVRCTLWRGSAWMH